MPPWPRVRSFLKIPRKGKHPLGPLGRPSANVDPWRGGWRPWRLRRPFSDTGRPGAAGAWGPCGDIFGHEAQGGRPTPGNPEAHGPSRIQRVLGRMLLWPLGPSCAKYKRCWRNRPQEPLGGSPPLNGMDAGAPGSSVAGGPSPRGAPRGARLGSQFARWSYLFGTLRVRVEALQKKVCVTPCLEKKVCVTYKKHASPSHLKVCVTGQIKKFV